MFAGLSGLLTVSYSSCISTSGCRSCRRTAPGLHLSKPGFPLCNTTTMKHRDTKELASFLRKEINNYIGSLPRSLREGTADASDCALRIGKLLNWISSTLDAGEFPKTHPQSILALADDFQRVGLELCDAKARGRLPNANTETLIRLRTVIDDLVDLERSATHVLSK